MENTVAGGKPGIPAELWSAAVEVASKEGINRTARELHVGWDDLKRRMSAADRSRSGSNRPSWSWSRRRCNRFRECTLEVEGRGGKLRIQLKGLLRLASGDALSRELVESAS